MATQDPLVIPTQLYVIVDEVYNVYDSFSQNEIIVETVLEYYQNLYPDKKISAHKLGILSEESIEALSAIEKDKLNVKLACFPSLNTPERAKIKKYYTDIYENNINDLNSLRKRELE